MPRNLSVALVALCATSLVLAIAQPAFSQQRANAGESWVLAVPKRRAPDAAPSAPPNVPLSTSISPSTLHVVMHRDSTRGRSRPSRQTVSRTSDKIHIAGSDGREWLFERNSIDPRRVSAALIEHSSKTIVLYEESDLRIALGIRGWADVLTLGFDSQLLGRYKRTRDARAIGGIRFVRYAGTGSSGASNDVWWSDEQVLPSQFATADDSGTRRFSLERARTGVDATVLAPATVRFPSYRVIDLADWLEKR